MDTPIVNSEIYTKPVVYQKADGKPATLQLPLVEIPAGTLLFRGIQLPNPKKDEDPRMFVRDWLGYPRGDRFCLTATHNTFFYTSPYVPFGAHTVGEWFNAIMVYQTVKNVKVVAMISPSKWIRGGKEIKALDGGAPIQRCDKFDFSCLDKRDSAEAKKEKEQKSWDNCIHPDFAQEEHVSGWMAIADYDSLDNFKEGLKGKDTTMGKYIQELEARLPGKGIELLTSTYTDQAGHRGFPELVLYPWSPHPGKQNQYTEARNEEEAADAIAEISDRFNYLPIACVTERGILEAFTGDFKAGDLPKYATSATPGSVTRKAVDKYLADYMNKLMTKGVDIEGIGNTKLLFDARTGFYVSDKFLGTYGNAVSPQPYRNHCFDLDTPEKRERVTEYKIKYRSYDEKKKFKPNTYLDGTPLAHRVFIFERPDELYKQYKELSIKFPATFITYTLAATKRFQEDLYERKLKDDPRGAEEAKRKIQEANDKIKASLQMIAEKKAERNKKATAKAIKDVEKAEKAVKLEAKQEEAKPTRINESIFGTAADSIDPATVHLVDVPSDGWCFYSGLLFSVGAPPNYPLKTPMDFKNEGYKYKDIGLNYIQSFIRLIQARIDADPNRQRYKDAYTAVEEEQRLMSYDDYINELDNMPDRLEEEHWADPDYGIGQAASKILNAYIVIYRKDPANPTRFIKTAEYNENKVQDRMIRLFWINFNHYQIIVDKVSGTPPQTPPGTPPQTPPYETPKTPKTLKTPNYSAYQGDKALLLGEQKTIPILKTLEEAKELGMEVINQANFNTFPDLTDGFEVAYSLPLEMNENSLTTTLKYVFEKLHHTCYMLCVKNNLPYLFKLEGGGLAPKIRGILEKEIQQKGITDIDLDNTRIMQCIVKPYKEQSTVATEWLELLQSMVKEGYKFPNGIYIMNLTDAVILREDGMEPWQLFTKELVPLEAEYRNKYWLPILSYSSANKYDDIAMPNFDDLFKVVRREDGSVDDEATLGGAINLDWYDKKNRAIFRGGTTGCGYTSETNDRIKITDPAFLETLKNKKMLDVGITTITKQYKMDGKNGLGKVDPSKIKVAQPVSMADQSNYKYIIHIDGNVYAYRLLMSMLTGSCILRVDSPYRGWADYSLVHFEINNPKSKAENADVILIDEHLTNLDQILDWCRDNEDICEEIAMRAREKALYFLEKRFIYGSFINSLILTKNISMMGGGRKEKKTRKIKHSKRKTRKLRKQEEEPFVIAKYKGGGIEPTMEEYVQNTMNRVWSNWLKLNT